LTCNILLLYSKYCMPEDHPENHSQLQFLGDTVHRRLKYWRAEVAKVSQADLCREVNRHLPADDRVAVTTVSNYERTTEPRASFLAALKTVYPSLSLEWFVSGEGRPLQGSGTTMSERANVASGRGETAVSSLMDQPGMHRFRVLPQPAAFILLAFLDEVRQSVPDYQGDQSRSWRDFLQRFSHFFFEPFQSTRHFQAVDTMSDGELTNYTIALIGAVRPLVMSFHNP